MSDPTRLVGKLQIPLPLNKIDTDTKIKEDMERIMVDGADSKDSEEETGKAEVQGPDKTEEPITQLLLPRGFLEDNATTSPRQPDDGLVAQNARSTSITNVSTLRKSSFLDQRGSKQQETTSSVTGKTTTGRRSSALQAKLAIANRSNAVRERATRDCMARRASGGAGGFLSQKPAMANRRVGKQSYSHVVRGKELTNNDPVEEADEAPQDGVEIITSIMVMSR